VSPEYRTGFQPARREFELGMQIRELRLAADLTPKELARMVGTSQPAIARLEAGGGMPRIDTQERVAQALGAELSVGLRTVPDSVRPPRRLSLDSAKAQSGRSPRRGLGVCSVDQVDLAGPHRLMTIFPRACPSTR
jgi:transcriptional regulator with XRE-family HTH domain